jgi:hypothetical protein
MEIERWNQLVHDLEGDDIERMVEASEYLQRESTDEDIPRLLELLHRSSFVVREAAAWPLASIGGPRFLPELFDAYQKGFDEGYDNDGFSTALIELVELHKDEARTNLRSLLESPNPLYRENATWLLDFC